MGYSGHVADLRSGEAKTGPSAEHGDNSGSSGALSDLTFPNSDLQTYDPIGQSRQIVQVRRLLEQVASVGTNVLITGESGTGKEWAARYLHTLGNRSDKPFAAVNCAAIPAGLLESELFGHEKGTFNGAISTRIGRFESAEGGTVFLDEIADMSLPMQAKLLRVIRERAFKRIGSNHSIACDVRIVASTHRDLESAIADGTFGEDLYHRLNVVPIEMPPLRSRDEDLPLLVESILSNRVSSGHDRIRLTLGAQRVLKQYNWPGNIRELSSLLERLCVLYPGKTVDISDLPSRYSAGVPLRASDTEAMVGKRTAGASPEDFELPGESCSLKEYLGKIEIALIRRALSESDGVVADAARRLRIGRTTLSEKIKRYNLP